MHDAAVMNRWFVAGASTTIIGRAIFLRLLLRKFTRDVQSLGAGDYGPLLRSYHRDAILRFAEGHHRWSGEHRGVEAIESFLQEFVNAGLQGEISEAYFGGPPWCMTIVAGFNDYAFGADGSIVYNNRTVLLVRTKWGKIMEQEDYYEDTERIENFENYLREVGNYGRNRQVGE